MKLPYSINAHSTNALDKPSRERWLNLRFELTSDASWAKAGHEVAWAQFLLPVTKDDARDTRAFGGISTPALSITPDRNHIRVRGPEFSLTYNTITGTFDTWTCQGTQLLSAGPRLNFWRALTDNDNPPRSDAGATTGKYWSKYRVQALEQRVTDFFTESISDSTVRAALPRDQQQDADGARSSLVSLDGSPALRLHVKTRIAPPSLAWGLLCEYIYTIDASGDIALRVKGNPIGEFPRVLPRIGIQLTIPENLEYVTWYGRGPHESYPDSKQSARVGVYQMTVRDLHTPYVFPQENGNRSDVRWVALTNARGVGFVVTGHPLLNFSAHHYTAVDLDGARHTCELKERDEITLNLDYAENGLGTASCGPGVLPQYELVTGPFDFLLHLQAFSKDEISPAALARRLRSRC